VSKAFVLLSSIFSLIVSVLYSLSHAFQKSVAIVTTLALVFSFAMVALAVYTDARRRDKPEMFAALGLVLGGLGGLIYYSMVKDESDADLPAYKGMSEGAKRSALIFNYILSAVFGLIVIINIITIFAYWHDFKAGSVSIGTTVFFTVLLFISLSAIAFLKRR
jgi:hypothetical protein